MSTGEKGTYRGGRESEQRERNFIYICTFATEEFRKELEGGAGGILHAIECPEDPDDQWASEGLGPDTTAVLWVL